MIRDASPGPDGSHSTAFAATFRWLVLASVAVILSVVALEGYRLYRVVSDVKAGRAALRSGQSRIESKRLDATTEDLTTARLDFQAAGASFASARKRLRGDHVLAAISRVPGVGGQVSAAADLARVGEQASLIGQQGVDAADAFNQVRADPNGTLPEKTVAVFDAADPHVAGIRDALGSVDARRESIGSRSLLPPMRAAVDELDARRRRLQDFLDTYQRAHDFAPQFLGFDGPRTYLILAQNEAELMPGGGLVSVFGTMRLDRGHIDSIEFHDAVQYGEDWMDRTGAYVEPPRPLKQYLLKDTSWNLAVSNWSPDFPTAAESARRFYQLGGGGQIDGVIAIDVATLERLLSIIGPVYVPEFDVTVDADNAYDLTEEYTRAPYEPQGDRKAFAGLLADEVLRRVLHPEAGQWSPLVDALQDLGDHKDMMLYSFDPKQETVIRQLGWDGSVGYTSGDYLAVVDASINSTKLNAIIEHSADIDVRLQPDGSAETTVTLDYFNNLRPWEQGRDPDLVEKLMLGGMYGGYLRLLTPPGSRIVSVTDAGNEIGVEEVSREKGLSVFGRFFALPRDTRQRLQFTYVTPAVARKDASGWRYSLALRRQPGWEQSAVTVHVAPPDGMRARDVRIDGEVAAWRGGQAKIDLSRDRVLTLRF